MTCPACGTKLECEDAPVVTGYGLTPGAHYRCEDCDTEYVWIKPGPLRRIAEGRPELMHLLAPDRKGRT